MRYSKGQRFLHIRDESGKQPVFSEAFLYRKIGKEDGRFVLGVAEEYDKVIRKLGTDKVWELLSTDEEKARAKSDIANTLFASRRALNDAAAALCPLCKRGVPIDETKEYRAPFTMEHSRRRTPEDPPYQPSEGDTSFSEYQVVEPCKAADIRKALDQIGFSISLWGDAAGIDTSPAPHKFEAASHPPESWCKECWLSPRADCHDRRRIEEAAGWKQ